MIGVNLFKGIFGDAGLTGNIIEILKGAGVLKNPEAIAKAEVALKDSESKIIESVNATIREEIKSDKWIQYSWRPCVGFSFCAVIINNYILLPYFQIWGLKMIVIPDGVWSAMLLVLGISAGTRGVEKIVDKK